VSSFDGQDLGQQVDRALATITAGPTPAAAILARGRRIRRRRRAARAGAVAVVAALAVAIPGLVYTAMHGGP
jgi:NO-binding membrane sensor protein with MHYT domain